MGFHRILIATDFSSSADAAIEVASQSCMMDGSEITLLNVCHSYIGTSDEDTTALPPLPALMEDHRQACRSGALKRLEQIASDRFPGKRVRCEAVIPKLSVGEEISAFAKQNSTDLIILGSRGHTRLSSLFVASTVQRVILTAHSPVLVVRPKE